MRFDIAAARAAGYSDEDIAAEIGSKLGFDTGAALRAGFSVGSILDEFKNSGKVDLLDHGGTDRFVAGQSALRHAEETMREDEAASDAAFGIFPSSGRRLSATQPGVMRGFVDERPAASETMAGGKFPVPVSRAGAEALEGAVKAGETVPIDVPSSRLGAVGRGLKVAAQNVGEARRNAEEGEMPPLTTMDRIGMNRAVDENADPSFWQSAFSDRIKQGIEGAKLSFYGISTAGVVEDRRRAFESGATEDVIEAYDRRLAELDEDATAALNRSAQLAATRSRESKEFFRESKNESAVDTLTRLGRLLISSPTAALRIMHDVSMESAPQSLAIMAAALAAPSATTAAAAGGGASALMEFGNQYSKLREQGVGNDEAWNKAAVTGVAVGLFDGASMAAAGGAGRNIIAQRTLPARASAAVKESAKQIPVQGALGGGGAAWGQVLTDEIGKPGAVQDIAAEILGEAGPLSTATEMIGATRMTRQERAQVAAGMPQAREMVDRTFSNFTEPDSPSARAGLTPIVVPVKTAAPAGQDGAQASATAPGASEQPAALRAPQGLDLTAALSDGQMAALGVAPSAQVVAPAEAAGAEPVAEAGGAARIEDKGPAPPALAPIDVTAATGAPFRTERAATLSLRQRGMAGTHAVVAVPGGFVLRLAPAQATVPATVDQPQETMVDQTRGATASPAIDVNRVRDAVRKVVGDFADDVRLTTSAEVSQSRPDVRQSPKLEGFFDTKTKQIVAMTDRAQELRGDDGAIILTPEQHLTWFATHESLHAAFDDRAERGIVGTGVAKMARDADGYTRALRLASSNTNVLKIAERISKARGNVSRGISIEEALVEIGAATSVKNGWQELELRYGVSFAKEQRHVLAQLWARLVVATKGALNAAGIKVKLTDRDVLALLRNTVASAKVARAVRGPHSAGVGTMPTFESLESDRNGVARIDEILADESRLRLAATSGLGGEPTGAQIEGARQQLLAWRRVLSSPPSSSGRYGGETARTTRAESDSVSSRAIEEVTRLRREFIKGKWAAQDVAIEPNDDGRALFEVAPDPNDEALATRWRALADADRQRISDDVVREQIVPLLHELGVEARISSQIGSYADDTNPPYSIQTADPRLTQIAGAIGFVASQDSMMAVRQTAFDGGERVGLIKVKFPSAPDVATARRVYGLLREIRVDGEQPIGGQTTVGDEMWILNYSGVPTRHLADLVSEKLGARYTMSVDEAFASFQQKEEYDYAGHQRDAGAARGVVAQVHGWNGRLHRARQETSAAIRDRLDAAEGGATRNSEGRSESSRLSSEGRPETDVGAAGGFAESTVRSGGRDGRGDGSRRGPAEGAVEVVGVHYGRERVPLLSGSRFGSGIKGEEKGRVFSSRDQRIKRRIYFYIGERGKPLPPPKEGLGPWVYRADLNNLYDQHSGVPVEFDRTSRDGWPLDRNEINNRWESAILDAGYDGYVNRERGVAVVLNRDVGAELLGRRDEIESLRSEGRPKESAISDDEMAESNDELNVELAEHIDYADVPLPEDIPEIDNDDLPRAARLAAAKEGKLSFVSKTDKANDLYTTIPTKARSAMLSAWREIAKKPGAFRFAKEVSRSAKPLDPKDARRLANELGISKKYRLRIQNEGPVDDRWSGQRWAVQSMRVVFETHDGANVGYGDLWYHGSDLYEAAKVNGFRRKGPYLTAHTSGFDPNTGVGTYFYQLAGAMAGASKTPLMPDVGLTRINGHRRTEQMISQALRAGSTGDILPGNKQAVSGWNERANTPEQRDRNLVRLLIASARNVQTLIPESVDARYDPHTDKFSYEDGRDAEPDVTEWMRRPATRSAGIGRATLARTVLSQQILDGALRAEEISRFEKPLLYSEAVERGVARHSANPEQFRRQIDAALEDGSDSRTLVTMSLTPDVLQQLGVERKSLAVDYGVLAKIHDRHGLTPAQIASLPNKIADPIFVFEDDQRPGEFRVITNEMRNGVPVMVAIKPNDVVGRISLPFMVSAYERSKFYATAKGWIKSGLLRYANKEKALKLATTYGAQFPGVVQRAEGFRVPKYLTRADLKSTAAEWTDKPLLSSGRPETVLESAVSGRAKPSSAYEAPQRSGILDALFRAAGGKALGRYITEPAYRTLTRMAGSIVPERAKHGLVSDYGLDEPYLDRKAERDAGINKELRKTKNLLDALAGLNSEQSAVAYQWMGEQPDEAIEQYLLERLPPEQREALARMKMMIDDLGQEAVRLGLLSLDSYERNHMAYLHRVYARHVIGKEDSALAAAKRSATLRGENFKGRGLVDWVPDDKLIESTKEVEKGDKFLRLENRSAATADEIKRGRSGELLRAVTYIPASEETVPERYAGWTEAGVWEARFGFDGPARGKVGMWRDLTKEERQRLGEIEEVRFSFAKTALNAVRDIENARFLEWVRDEYARPKEDIDQSKIVEAGAGFYSVKTYAPDEWVQVPQVEIAGTNLRRHGALAGEFIPGPIWNDIRNTMAVPESDLARTYDAVMRAWKVSKTALSPTVHTNNVMSNFILADLANVRARDIVRALKTIIKAKAGDADAMRLMERYEDSGAEYGSWQAIELNKDFIAPLLRELDGIRDNEMSSQFTVLNLLSMAMRGNWEAAKALKHKGAARAAAWPFKSLIKLYQSEDAVFRVAKFVREVDAGASDIEAGKASRKAFLDYNINAPWIQAARRTMLPFIAFSYRAIPLAAEAVAKKPWKMMKYYAIGSALNALAYAMLGADADEDRERRRLPEEVAGRIWGVFPRTLRMPWNDSFDSPVMLDLRRWVPAGDVFDLNQSHAVIPLPGWLTVGGPLAAFMELMSNKSGFSGRDLVKESDSPGEVANKIGDWAFKWMAPNLPLPNPFAYVIPGANDGQYQTYSVQNIIDAGSGATDKLGRDISLAQAALNALGVKVRSYPEDTAADREIKKVERLKREIGENISDLKRRHQRGMITEKEFELRLEVQQRKKERLSEHLAETLD